MYRESENPYFSSIFFNMVISLIVSPICLKTSMSIPNICMEGSMSQNFLLCHVEEGILREKIQKITKVTRFLS